METLNSILDAIDGYVWGVPLIVIILFVGILLTIRLGCLQVMNLHNALRFMAHSEKDGAGEVSSFGALCTALAATIGTGNIVGVATAIGTGGPGALFWMEVAAFLGMATKYAEGLLAVKYRTVAKACSPSSIAQSIRKARFSVVRSITLKRVSRNASAGT